MVSPKLQALVVLRFYTVANIAVTALVLGGDFESTQVFHHSALGQLILYALWLLVVLYIFDTIVNDFMPTRYTSPITKRWRVLGFMSLSILMSCSAFLILVNHGGAFIVLRCLIESAAAVATAFLGLRELMNRHQFPFERRKSISI